MPTFVILTSGSESARVQGADRAALTAAVEKAVKAAKPVYSSGLGHTLGSAPSAPKVVPRWVKEGNVGATPPVTVGVGDWLDTVVAFVALYLYTLFSIDAIGAAEQSGFPVIGGGSDGGSGGGGPGGPGGPGGRRVGTVQGFGRTVGGCAGGSCG
jgi:thioredoxin 1